MNDTLPPGTKVETPRHGPGTVIDTEPLNPAVYHRWWPVWVRLDDPTDERFRDEGYEVRQLVVVSEAP